MWLCFAACARGLPLAAMPRRPRRRAGRPGRCASSTRSRRAVPPICSPARSRTGSAAPSASPSSWRRAPAPAAPSGCSRSPPRRPTATISSSPMCRSWCWPRSAIRGSAMRRCAISPISLISRARRSCCRSIRQAASRRSISSSPRPRRAASRCPIPPRASAAWDNCSPNPLPSRPASPSSMCPTRAPRRGSWIWSAATSRSRPRP